MALHSPRLPFGSVHVESLTPVFQTDGVYGLNPDQVLATTSGSGTATTSDSSLVVSTGTTIYSQGVIQSRKRLRYRPGQGVVGRFTASYTTPVTSSYQVVGLGHAEDGIFIGYKNTDFGILYSQRGVRECRTLTVATGSSTAQNVTVTLNGTAYTVAVTNSGSAAKTAYEISIGTYAGWSAQQVGATVVFLADSVGAKSGSYSLTATTAAGSFAQTKAGVAATEQFIKQSDWNGDKLDGTGGSGVVLDPTKLNVFQIMIQYLGAGTITIQAEVVSAGNNADFATIHQILLPNTLTATSLGNPSFPFTMATYSAGSTTNLTVKCGSFAGFVEGEKRLNGPRLSYYDTSSSVANNAYTTLFTVSNSLMYGGRANQAVINVLSISAAQQHNNVSSIFVIKNATLSAGTPSFASFASNSVGLQDNGATACTFTNNQLVWSGQLGASSNLSFAFTDEIEIQPGETLTVAARTAAGNPSTLVVNLNTREDQ